jgi:hypothetical protein
VTKSPHPLPIPKPAAILRYKELSSAGFAEARLSRAVRISSPPVSIPHHQLPSFFISRLVQSLAVNYLFAGVLGNEGDTLLNVLLEVANAGLKQVLLDSVNLTDGQDLLNTLGTKLDLGGEEVDALVLVKGRVDKGRLNDALLALGSAEDGVSHAGTGHSHGQGSGTRTILGLDDLITAKLDALDEVSVGGQVGVVALAEERHDGHARVAADNGDVLVLGVGALDLGDEAAGTDDIEGGDTEEGLGVVDTTGLEDLGADGDGGVDGVGNDEQLSLGGGLGDSLGQVTDDGGVSVEQVVTRHAGLAGDAGRDEHDVGALEAGSQARGGRVVALDGGLGVDVGNIGGDAYVLSDQSVSNRSLEKKSSGSRKLQKSASQQTMTKRAACICLGHLN